ncbi:hypothetical protein HBI56_087560 [Parastagonospora nodorum]|nr:hypothetical protein HBH75_119510 [Parastagonospora nodorum]KAH4966654.1 hypothetical protein HBI78_084920 [Parastagonospora nodorum]KAH4989525.1 hypothetical protein HBI76_074350 [Parastagonospora nodorum]KAH5138960.1 hypothetical protein HBH70_098700 [Parastagonospora nodorum]KAH5190471.1 hypothetical protein HBH77_158050 [Parastagonospora nodorum]
MGRTERSQGLAPPAIRKDIRAKQAKHVINKVIPALLASNSRASKGVESSELIVDPASSNTNASSKLETEAQDDAAYIKRKGQGRRKAKNETGAHTSGETTKGKGRKRQDSVDLNLASLSINEPPPPAPAKSRKIRILTTDTLTAAHILGHPSKPSKKQPNICILNMASPLRPGGGVLTGATSQEEFLCARTTLLPSLQESYYRLPELGGIWSPEVLVFFNRLPLGDARGELGPADRYFVDVISAGMLRFPELEGEEDEVKRLGKKDRVLVENKMRAVLRIATRKGVRKMVLGAWGCGAYGNPVVDIAEAWRKVLDGTTGSSGKKKNKSEPETWPGIEEVIFAISNRGMAANFAQAFDENMEVEPGPTDSTEDDDDDEEDRVAEELRTKIGEMEGQLSKVWNPDLKARMGTIVDGLKLQLKQRTEGNSLSDEDDESSTTAAQMTPEDSDEEDSGVEEEDDDDDDDDNSD